MARSGSAGAAADDDASSEAMVQATPWVTPQVTVLVRVLRAPGPWTRPWAGASHWESKAPQAL
jgi:hypothetical protein